MGVFGGPNVSEGGLVLALDGANYKSFKGEGTTNLIPSPTEEMPRGEFGQYRDLASIFDTNGLTAYSLSMDIKTNIPGNVFVYMQNGSYTKYGFVGSNVYCTTEYQRFYFNNLTPVLSSTWQQNTPNDNRAVLATYTGYGSGINPTVKDIQLEQRSYSTKFVSGTRGTTVATGGGWADLSANGNNGELVNGVRESSANLGALVFDGSNDYVDCGKTATQFGVYDADYTFDAWVYPTNLDSDKTMFGTDQTASRQGLHLVFRSGAIYQGHYGADFSAGSATLNAWNNISYTYVKSSSSASIYKNGVLQGSGSIASFIGTTNILIGRWASNYYFSGTGSNYKIYNRALTAAEVRQNYNALKGRFSI